MYEIEVSNRQKLLKVDSQWIREIVQKTLEAEQVHRAEIDVAILDDAAIHVVNRDHLEHDYPTDVISFLYDADESLHPADSALRGAGLEIEGELVVSAETAIRIAAEMNWDPLNELTLYIVHGLLHLCGYDDLTDDEQVIMRQREREILQIWNLTPHYSY
ncbi:rRNA maturation RNase YbeY [Planctomicrobium sp. SH668]|uniref:rRNA maturation RNase YbeY n=1 Tax=Planctomicrobium sp. SH668 TaxID=3448126 RepID=UPI003F5CA6AB